MLPQCHWDCRLLIALNLSSRIFSNLFSCSGGKPLSFVIIVGMQGEQLRRKKVIEIVDESPAPLGSKK